MSPGMQSSLPRMAPKAIERASEAQTAQSTLSEQPARFSPETINDVQRVACIFYDGGLMPKHFYDDKRVKPEDRRPAGIAGLATMIMYGAELGLSPMQAMRMMHVIEGRPVLTAEGCVALIKRSPKCVYFRVIEESDEHCICETVRRGDDGKPEPAHRLHVRVWWGAIEELPKAEKGMLYVLPTRVSGNGLAPAWQRTPGRMVKARCSSWLGHDVYEDVLAGLYSAEEMIDFRDGRSSERIQDRIFDMVAEAPAPVRGAGTDPEAPVAPPVAPAPVTETAQGAPVAEKPGLSPADLKALLTRVQGANDNTTAEEIAELRAKVEAFNGVAPLGYPRLVEAWTANEFLGPYVVTP